MTNAQKRKRRSSAPAFLLLAMLALPAAGLAADGDWSMKADVQGMHGVYSGSVKRSSLSGAGLFLRADHLDQSGLTLGVNALQLKFRQAPTIRQQEYFASLRHNLYFDALPGIIGLRVDGHWINNNDVTGDTDNVRVVEPRLSFLNYAKTFYMDVGFAYSRYRNNLNVQQLTPTLGFGFNRGADWLQARGYFIRTSNPARAQNKRRTSAVDLKWTHWFAPGAWHRLDNIQLGVLAGERIYAVDGDAGATYNLADIQRGSLSVAFQWRLSDAWKLMLMGGDERYLDNAIGNSYDNRFGYADISVNW